MELAVDFLKAAGKLCAPLGLVVRPELEGILFEGWRVSPAARRNRRVASVRGQARGAAGASLTSALVQISNDKMIGCSNI